MTRSNRKPHWAASVPDYGEHAGIGTPSAVDGRLVVKGVLPGREQDFMAFLSAQGDAVSRRLLSKTKASPAAWDRELRSWVRKRLARGIALPDSVDFRQYNS